MQPARIAVIADTSLQRHVLQHALTRNGYQVVLNSDPARLDEEALERCAAQLWLVDLSVSDELPLVDELLASASAPVLFGEGHAPERHSEHYPRWERRLVGKLKKLVGDGTLAVGPGLDALADAQRPSRIALPELLARMPLQAGEPARQVWLLAASLGGPEAVKAFLDALPGGLPVGFLYAQHIDAGFEAALPQAVGRHSQWRVGAVRDGDRVRCGEVLVVPVSQELRFSAARTLQLSADTWPEPYSPSIDQMMVNLAQCYGSASGVIVFSGMGCDGSSAAAYLQRQGGLIWTQSADSCVCASMPDSVREGGFSLFTGDPRELAAALVEHLAGQCH